MATSRDIEFDPVGHLYRLRPSGMVLPSVTRILRETGVSTDFDALPNKDAIARKRDIGTAAHSDCHAFDDGDLDWPTVNPEVLPYVEAWAVFREHKKLRPIVRERIVYDPHQGYVGTFDGIFESPAYDRPILVDMKLGDPRDAAAQFQTAAYQSAYSIEHPAGHAMSRWSVQLIPGRRVPYEITPYSDFKDFEIWRAIVATFYAAARRRSAA